MTLKKPRKLLKRLVPQSNSRNTFTTTFDHIKTTPETPLYGGVFGCLSCYTMSMTDDQFKKIFLAIQALDAKMDTRFDEAGTKFDQVYEVLDSQTGILDKLDTENSVIDHQLSRQEDWIEQVAPVVKVKYSHP